MNLMDIAAPRLATRGLTIVCTALLAAPALAVVRHPDAYESSTGDPTGPQPTWFARWDDDASAVAVGPNHILTTRHQGGGVGSTVVFPTINVPPGGNTGTYVATAETILGPDLRLVTISGTLSSYASVYDGPVLGSSIVLGGFGAQRVSDRVEGNNVLTGYITNYNALTTVTQNNNPLLLGANRVESEIIDEGTPYLVADFDAPDQAPYSGVFLPPTNKVNHEASIGVADSGGGWFFNDNGTWKLVGVNAFADLENNLSTAPFYTTRDVNGVLTDFPALVGAVDVRPSAGTINSLIPEPATLSLLALGAMGLVRRRR